MPRLSAEISGVRGKRPSPVLVSSDHFLIVCFSAGCPHYPCMSAVSAGLLPQGAVFRVPWASEQNDFLDPHPCLCVRRYVCFSRIVVSFGGQLWLSRKIPGPGVRVSHQEFFALPLSSHVTLDNPGIPVECCFIIRKRDYVFPSAIVRTKWDSRWEASSVWGSRIRNDRYSSFLWLSNKSLKTWWLKTPVVLLPLIVCVWAGGVRDLGSA